MKPGRDLLPVTEDMLLTEEEVERLLSEVPGPFELSQAVLQFGESPAPAAGTSETAAPVAPGAPVAAMPFLAHQGPTGLPSSGKRLAARDRRNSSARWIFLAVALLCVAGAGVWFAIPPAARPPKKQNATDILAHANRLPGPAVADGDAAGAIVSDLFDYPHKSELKGHAGGAGWDGPWTATKAIIAPGSLIAGQSASGKSGGHVSLAVAEQSGLARLYAKSVVLPDPKSGGEWWASLLVSHTGGSTGDGGELWINFFSGANINSVIRLTLTEKGRALQLLGGNSKPVAIQAEPGGAIRIVARVQAKPAAGGKFDFLMDVWINPGKAEALTKPGLALSLKGAAMSGHPGFSMQKLLQKAPGTTRLDQLIIGRTAAAVMK